jgi:hypothetical protein
MRTHSLPLGYKLARALSIAAFITFALTQSANATASIELSFNGGGGCEPSSQHPDCSTQGRTSLDIGVHATSNQQGLITDQETSATDFSVSAPTGAFIGFIFRFSMDFRLDNPLFEGTESLTHF